MKKVATVIGLFLSFTLGQFANSQTVNLDYEIQQGELKLLSLTDFNGYADIDVVSNGQTARLGNFLFNTSSHYLLLDGRDEPQTYNIAIAPRYAESAQLTFNSSLENLDASTLISMEDSIALSTLSLEQLADLQVQYICNATSLNARLNNQKFLTHIDALHKLERHFDAISAYQQSCLTDKTDKNQLDILVLSYNALSLLELSKFKDAIPPLLEVASWYQANFGGEQTSRAFHEVQTHFGLVARLHGRSSRNSSLAEEGLAALQQAHDYFVQQGFEYSTIFTLAHLWSHFASERDYQQALNALNLSIDTIDSVAPMELKQKASNYNHMSLTYKQMGDMSKAIETMRKSIAIREVDEMSFTLSATYLNLGSLYLQIGDFDMAEKYYLRIKDYVEQHKSDFSFATLNDGLAVIALYRGQLETAEHYLNIALQKYDPAHPRHMAKMKMRLGYSATLRGDLEEAQSYLDSAAEHYEEGEITRRNMMYYIRRGGLHIAKGELPEAQQVVDRLEAFLNSLPDAENMPEGTKPLFLNYQINFLDLKLALLALSDSKKSSKDDLKNATKMVRAVSAGLDIARAGPVWADFTNRIVSRYITSLHESFLQTNDPQLLEDMFLVLENNAAFSARRQRQQAQTIAESQPEQGFLQQSYNSQVDKAQMAVMNAENSKARMDAQFALNEARERFRLSSTPLKKRQFEEPTVPTIAETQNMLRSDEVVIRFFVMNNDLLPLCHHTASLAIGTR